MKNRIRSFVVLSLTSLFLLSAVGCGSGNNADSMIADLNSTNSKRLANLYAFFQMSNDWQGPKDEAEFKEFIKAQSPKRLKRAGIEVADIDGLFASERDGKPFKVRWGLVSRVRGPSLPVVFEEEGVDGLRQVGFTGSAMQEVDSTEYDRLWNMDADEAPVQGDDSGERG